MEQLNIPSTVNDSHYSYKMPKIQTAVQGSVNGIKTNWINLPDVSNALKVPFEYPIKFIERELGSNTELKQNSYFIRFSGHIYMLVFKRVYHQDKKILFYLTSVTVSFILC